MRMRKAPQKRVGSAAVEFAIILPLVVFLLLGLWEGGRILDAHQIIDNAAREGARQAAAGQMNTAQVQQAVVNYLKSAGLTVSSTDPSTVCTLKNLGFSGNPAPADDDPTNAYFLDRLQVTVQLPLKDVRWVASSLVLDTNGMLSTTVIWSSMRDKPFPAIDYPSGQ